MVVSLSLWSARTRLVGVEKHTNIEATEHEFKDLLAWACPRTYIGSSFTGRRAARVLKLDLPKLADNGITPCVMRVTCLGISETYDHDRHVYPVVKIREVWSDIEQGYFIEKAMGRRRGARESRN